MFPILAAASDTIAEHGLSGNAIHFTISEIAGGIVVLLGAAAAVWSAFKPSKEGATTIWVGEQLRTVTEHFEHLLSEHGAAQQRQCSIHQSTFAKEIEESGKASANTLGEVEKRITGRLEHIATSIRDQQLASDKKVDDVAAQLNRLIGALAMFSTIQTGGSFAQGMKAASEGK